MADARRRGLGRGREGGKGNENFCITDWLSMQYKRLLALLFLFHLQNEKSLTPRKNLETNRVLES